MDSNAYLFLLWGAAVAFAAFLMVVVKPKMRALEQKGWQECERLCAAMDQVVSCKSRLSTLAPLVLSEQRAFDELAGAASLESLERRCAEFRNAGSLLVALEVDAGTLEGDLELVISRHGRLFYWCFLRSTVITARHVVSEAQQMKSSLLQSRSTATVS